MYYRLFNINIVEEIKVDNIEIIKGYYLLEKDDFIDLCNGVV